MFTAPVLHKIVYGDVPPVITKDITPSEVFGPDGFTTSHSTPNGKSVIGSHSFLKSGLVVVVVVYGVGGGRPGVFVGVGVTVLVRLTVGVKLGVGEGVAV